MPNWEGSDRRSRLPADWSATRRRIMRRDGGRCTHLSEDGVRCDEPASDIDHVIHGDDHRDSNLTALCGPHHRAKSSREGGVAAAAKRARTNQKYRRRETHPGLL